MNIHFQLLYIPFLVHHGVEELCPVRMVTDSPQRPCLTLARLGKTARVACLIDMTSTG